MCCRSPRSATSAFITLTRTSPCGRMHVTATVSSCFAALRQLLSVRRCPPQQALLTHISALIISKVESTNAAQCWSAFLVTFWTDFSLSSTPPHDLIRFRLCVLTFRCLNGTSPSYLADSICRVADVEGRRHLRSSATLTLECPACQAINPGRPTILCRPSTGMELCAVSRTDCIVAHHFPTRTENISLLLEFSEQLVASSVSSYVICRFLIDCVKCPCSVPGDSVILNNRPNNNNGQHPHLLSVCHRNSRCVA